MIFLGLFLWRFTHRDDIPFLSIDQGEETVIGCQYVFHVLPDAAAESLQFGFFHRPQTDEGHIGPNRILDQFDFLLVHGVAHQRLIVIPDLFHIHTDRMVGEGAYHGALAMTHVEMDAGMVGEQGLAVSGDLIIGADSHTCTYGALGAFSTGVGSTDMAFGMASGKAWFKVPSAIRFKLIGSLPSFVSGKDVILHIIGMIGVDGALYRSMEFCGEGVSSLSIEDRLTICNMAIEAGAKNGIFPVDETTLEFEKGRAKHEPMIFAADEDAEYEAEYTVDLSALKPTVAFPHLPENTRTIDEVGDIKIDQVVIGSCTNGLYKDLAEAAEILKGRKVAKNIRAIIIPATPSIYLKCVEMGLVKTFIEAGCIVSTPTCGPCLGGYMGVLAAGERCVSTTNRNFIGRMGDTKSEVYLASPSVAAASAIMGRIAGPEEVMK